MAKVKQLLTEQGCVVCDTLYPIERAALGYVTCMPCGELLAKKVAANVIKENEYD